MAQLPGETPRELVARAAERADLRAEQIEELRRAQAAHERARYRAVRDALSSRWPSRWVC